MRGSSVVTAAVVVVLVMVSGPAPCHAQLSDVVAQIITYRQLMGPYNEIEFMGNTCHYTQRPRFRNWELYFYGDFSCPTWTKIKGSVETRSSSGLIIRTIEDFLNKAQANGLVTEEEARTWLERHEQGAGQRTRH